jgi:hypothetical protein
MLFYNVTCYTNSLWSHIDVNTVKLLHICVHVGCHKRDITEFKVYLN